MILSLIVKMLGGIWELRRRYRDSNNRTTKRLYLLLYDSALKRKGSWISMNATFKAEPCFPHGIYSIFISGGAIIGKNCVIFQQVVIGSNTLRDSGGAGAPTIGDDCYIGAGAKIIGGIYVGDNVRVGANAFVYQDVSDNSVISCATPRIIKMRKRMNNRFYHNYRGKWRCFSDGRWVEIEDQEEQQRLDRRQRRAED